jgi:hypothetical protein
MDQFVVGLIASLAAGLVLAAGGLAFQRLKGPRVIELPRFRGIRPDYTHLAGEWNLSWLTFSPGKASPQWRRGVQELEVSGQRVTGSIRLESNEKIVYVDAGQIRADRLMLLSACEGM